MPNKVKLRVVSAMPTKSPTLFLRVHRVITHLFVWGGLAGCRDGACNRGKPHLEEAVPIVYGTCEDVPLRRYVGPDDRDAKRCNYRGQVFWCVFDPGKTIWSCDFIEPTPAEKK